MKFNFTKMHGLGNDFVVIDALRQKIDLTPDLVRLISDRHRGVGCDQLLLVQSPNSADTDFFYRVFNADGTEVGQCGNGARCFAKFVYEKGLTKKRSMLVGTLTGKLELHLEADGDVSVNMGLPQFISDAGNSKKVLLSPAGEEIILGFVSLGNPHAVLQVENVDTAPVDILGEFIAKHAAFPKGTNVEFMQIIARDEIKLRVFERGVGETLACGSGACAAVVIGNLWGLLDSKVKANMPGGELRISLSPQGLVWMKGPAVKVFEGGWDNA